VTRLQTWKHLVQDIGGDLELWTGNGSEGFNLCSILSHTYLAQFWLLAHCHPFILTGTGGEEASLFAMDVFRMYERFAQKNSWNFEILDITESEMRAYKVCTTHNSPSSSI
jgi:hypothetical protein